MQNPHAKWRIDFAGHLAKRLLPFQEIQAIVVAGSVARDYADEYSDIELPIFWDPLPDDTTRQAVVRALNGKFLYAYDGPAQEDQLLIDGLQVDVWAVSTTHQEEILEAVLHKHQSDLGSLNALDTIRTCVPLFGEEIVRKWKIQAQEYPDELAEKIVREHLTAFRTGDLFLLAQRNNPAAFYSQLGFLQQEAFLVLLALNRMYFPTFKWLYPALESMTIKPEAIERRFRQVFQTSSQEALAETRLVLEEIVRLVEKQFPHLDTTLTHRRLSYTRTAQFADGHAPFMAGSQE